MLWPALLSAQLLAFLAPPQVVQPAVHRAHPRACAADAPGGSHVALRVSDIERSLDFWSLLDFAPTRKFSTSGARAAWLGAPWCSLALELIEVPSLMLAALADAPPPPDDAPGFAHLSLDVTPLGGELPRTLGRLQADSEERFGRTLVVLSPPRQQMMGDLVVEVAVIRAPDGVPLELLRRSGRIEGMEPDWT